MAYEWISLLAVGFFLVFVGNFLCEFGKILQAAIEKILEHFVKYFNRQTYKQTDRQQRILCNSALRQAANEINEKNKKNRKISMEVKGEKRDEANDICTFDVVELRRI